MVKHQAKKAERPVKKHHQKLQVPKTIDNMRVIDETMRTEETKAEDDEEDLHDEFQDVLSGRVPSKVMITTTIDADVFAEKFGLELQNVIPNSIFRKRRRYSSKEIVDSLKEVNYTSLIIVEQGKIKNSLPLLPIPYQIIIQSFTGPDGLWIVALPRGPTFRYRLRSVIYQKEIKGGTNATRHFPELNLHGFKTQLGHRTERMFQSLFPQKPDLEGRQIVTFHNQRDWIFFRRHRFIFDNIHTPRLQEIGPRFSLHTTTIQAGTFDKAAGMEYIPALGLEGGKRRFVL